MKSFKKPNSKILLGFCLWLTVFSSFAVIQGTSYKQTLEERNMTLSPGKRGRYSLRYIDYYDTEITVEATSNVSLYLILVNPAQWGESNQLWYENEENYITGEGLAYTMFRLQGTEFNEAWRSDTNDIRYIIIQNENEGDAALSLSIVKNDLSTVAMYFGIGAVVFLAGFFSWILISRKKQIVPVSEE